MFLMLVLVMVTLASLSACIIYLISQQEDGDFNSPLFQCYYDIWRLSQCYKLKHGFCYIYSLYEGVVLWPFWNWHEGTKNVHYYISHFVPCNGKLSLINESVVYFFFPLERLIDIDLVCHTWNSSISYCRQAELSR